MIDIDVDEIRLLLPELPALIWTTGHDAHLDRDCPRIRHAVSVWREPLKEFGRTRRKICYPCLKHWNGPNHALTGT